MKIYVKDILLKDDCKVLCGNLDEEINECFINSKKVKKDSTFIGLEGEKEDGSNYYAEAILNGAKICILNENTNIDLKKVDGKTIILSKHTLKTLQLLAETKRNKFQGTVIGITGSVGKTSTKNIIYEILSKKYKVLKTNGNENGQIGLPLNIMRLKDEDIMVLEMGLSKPGEMDILSKIAKPNICVITNIYDSHISNFKTKKRIFEEKIKITKYSNNPLVIANKNIKYLIEGNNIIRYSLDDINNIKEEKNKIIFDYDDIKNISITGVKELINNYLLGIIIGKKFNIENDNILSAINNYLNDDHRLKIINFKNDITIIDDSYNANFNSLKIALELLSKYNKEKILVLGDILENNNIEKLYRKIAKEINKYDIKYIITIGNDSKILNKFLNKNIMSFELEQQSRNYLLSIMKPNATVLFKGSNGIRLFELCEYIIKKMD